MSCSKWEKVLLGDYINIKHGFAFKGEFISGTENENILVTPGNFKIGGGFKDDKFRFFHGEYLEEYVLNPNDIIVTMTDLSKKGDTLGYSALVPNNSKKRYLHNQRIGLFEFINKGLDPLFIYWRLRCNDYHKFIVGASSGSTVKHTSPKTIKSFRFNIPPFQEQKYIASTLSCLDDKIELNNRINKNLEEMAQAIFKRWFVDFEFPDGNGNPYKSSGGEMVESELGDIPKGWQIKGLDNIASYLNGLAMQKYRPETNDFLRVIKIKELGQECTDENSDKASANISEEYIIHNGDVIFSWSGTLLIKIWTGGTGALNQHLFKVSSTVYDKWFYYLWTLKYLEDFKSIAKDKATTMGHIKRIHLTNSKVLVPNNSELNMMNDIMNPIIDHMTGIKIQNQTLQELRNSLLPKLMSGEIRVPCEEAV